MQNLTSQEVYENALKLYSNTCYLETQYLTCLNNLKNLNKETCIEIKDIVNRIEVNMEMNLNLKKNHKATIDFYEYDQCEFSLCLLVNNKKQVWISRRNNITKDYFDHYQATGGKKEPNENYGECALREAKEEADVNIDEFVFVILSKGFRKFPGEDKEVLYKTAVYFANIGDQIPKRVEQDRNDDWILVKLKDLHKYTLTKSLQENLPKIIEMINEKVKINSRKRKKPKVTENEQDINGNDNNHIENDSNVNSTLVE